MVDINKIVAGVKVMEGIAKESITFKDCSDFDVVGRSHKRKKKFHLGH